MSPKSRFLLFLLFSLVTASFYCKTQGQRLVGGYRPIKANDPEVQKAAAFAVEEQNKKIRGSIALVRILKAEAQVVAGTNYRILVAVTEGGVSKKYEAVVYVRPWQHYRQLLSFTPSY